MNNLPSLYYVSQEFTVMLLNFSAYRGFCF